MIKSTCYCDRCKQAITAARTELDILSGPIRSRIDCDSIDLCVGCANALVTWLTAPALAHAPALAVA